MNLKLVAGLLVASSSTVAVASMNNLNVQSHLGERFNGSIVVTGPTAQEILKSPSSVKISGAPVSARVSKQGDSAVIHLRSKTPINDPVMRLSIQAGTQSRHYSAIIDPKDSAHQAAQVNANKAIPAVPATAPNNAQVTTADKPENSAGTNANAQAAPNKTTNASTAAKKPAVEAPRVNKRTIQNNRHHAQNVKTPTVRSARVVAAEQYKVQPNDTIYAIASRFQPQGLSTAQTVNALLRANPQAFGNKNPNLLYGDATLNIPSAQDMHLLATGRMPQNKPTASTPSTAPKMATTAAVATVATAGVAAQADDASSNDVQAIKKQLAQLETQKKQLEQKLAQELAQEEAAKKAAIEAEKKAAAKAQKQAEDAAAEKKAADIANIDKQAAEDAEKKAASDAAQAASTPAIETPTPASAPQITASEPAASAVAVPAKPKKPAPLPEPEPEPELLDLIMQYLPYLAGGLITLLLVFLFLKKRQQKSNNDPDGGGDDNHDDGDIPFNLDDATTDKKDAPSNNDSNLTAAELDALNAFDSFDANSHESLHQATAQPTVAPKVIAGSTVIGAAAVGATYANNNALDNDFMPSAEDLAQFAHPDATAAPELDNFNLDDLDLVFKSHPSSSAPTAAPIQASKNDDLGDFDLNELDNLLQKNGFGDQTPAPIQNFTNQTHNDESLNFDLDDVLQNTNSFAQPSAALNLDKNTSKNTPNKASFDDFNDDFNLDTLNDLGNLPKTAMAQPAPTIKPTAAPAADEFDLGDFDLSSFENLNDTSHIAAAHFAPATKATTAPAADDFDLGDFDLSSFEKPNDTPQAAVDEFAPTTRPTAAPAADDFDLSDFDLSSFEKPNDIPNIAPAQSAPTVKPTSASALDDFDLSDFDVSGLDSLNEPSQTTAPTAKTPSLNDLDFEDDLQTNIVAKPSLNKTPDTNTVNFDSTTSANAGLTLSQEDINDINFDFNLDTISAQATPSAIAPVAAAALAVTAATVAEVEPVSNLSFDELDFPEEITATTTPKVEAELNAKADDSFALNLDELFSEPDEHTEIDSQPSSEKAPSAEEDEFVSKFSSISLESEHNQLAFDDSFGGLNFDDLLKTDDALNEPLPAAATESTSDFSELASPLEPAAATEFSVHDFKDFSIDAPPAKSDRPAQAWAGTGDFGLQAEDGVEPAANSLPTTEDTFDFGSLSFDNEDAAADTSNTQAVEDTALDLDALLKTDTDDLNGSEESIRLPMNDSILSLDDADGAKASALHNQADDLGFDLNLDDLNLDDLNSVEPSSQPAPTATPDIVSHQFDFQSNDEMNAPKETLATPEPEISESLSVEDFDLSFSVPASAQAVASTGIALDDLSLDDNNANTITTSEDGLDVFNLDDFDLSLDVAADTAAPSSNAFSLDDFALSLETEPTVNTNDNEISLALDELESFDLSAFTNTPNDASKPATEDISLNDFDLSFDLDMPSDTHLQAAANPSFTDALGGNATATTSDLEHLGLDLDLESAFESELFQESPDLAFAAPSVTPTTAPSIAAPLAMIETAPPIVDKDAYLSNMEHTYSAKWELAQMYADLGESDAAREILIDLIESGSETYSKRAQSLFGTL